MHHNLLLQKYSIQGFSKGISNTMSNVKKAQSNFNKIPPNRILEMLSHLKNRLALSPSEIFTQN